VILSKKWLKYRRALRKSGEKAARKEARKWERDLKLAEAINSGVVERLNKTHERKIKAIEKVYVHKEKLLESERERARNEKLYWQQRVNELSSIFQKAKLLMMDFQNRNDRILEIAGQNRAGANEIENLETKLDLHVIKTNKVIKIQ